MDVINFGWGEFAAVLGFAAVWLGAIMLAIRAPWDWKLVRDTGVHRYYAHPDGRRRVVKVAHAHQPIDRAWLVGGDWTPPQRRGPSCWMAGYYQSNASKAPRFSIRVDGVLFEADGFAGIIAQMREHGFETEDITAAALIVHHTPTGAELQR